VLEFRGLAWEPSVVRVVARTSLSLSGLLCIRAYMDFLTQQIIATAKKLSNRLDAIREGILTLHRDSQEQITATRQARNTQNERDNTPPILRAELQVPHPIEVQTSPKNKKQGQKWYKLVIETLTLIGVIWYADVATRQWREMIAARHQAQVAIEAAQNANQIAASNFANEQRPYIWFQASTPGFRRLDGKMEETIYIANYGKTPAIGVRCIGRIFYGQDARDKADSWLNKMNKGTLANRDISAALIPPKVPEDYRKDGFGFPALTENVPSESDLRYPRTNNFGKVIVARIEYYGLGRKTFYWSEFCLESKTADTAGGYCHHNENNMQ
jgi:hypothetical protein